MQESWQRCGPEPMPAYEEMLWAQTVDKFSASVLELNKKVALESIHALLPLTFNTSASPQVRNFNLIVPIVSRQRCLMSVDKELTRVKAIDVPPHGQVSADATSAAHAALSLMTCAVALRRGRANARRLDSRARLTHLLRSPSPYHNAFVPHGAPCSGAVTAHR